MKKCILFISILISFVSTNAQNDDYIISLAPKSTFENLRFSCIEVIDARKNKKNIGFVYRVFKGKVSAQLPEEFSSHLKKTFDKIIPIKKTQTFSTYILT